MYLLYKISRYLINKISSFITNLLTNFLFKIYKIQVDNKIKSNGIPYLVKHESSLFTIGKNFKMNNRAQDNPIGRGHKCMIIIRENAQLKIGDNVGMSGTTIVCQKNVIIGNNVKIGANTCIYDTDFHSLNSHNRLDSKLDRKNTLKKEIFIDDNAFIGAHSTILKGVKIGKNSIVGACSVVTKNIPDNEIWAGNPAKFIREIKNEIV
jgi:acetyltransferase-like isoleucine patch superfamily enzyme